MNFDQRFGGFLADVQGWQDAAERAPESSPACPGLCVTASDVGVFVEGNPVAYPHSDCPVHDDAGIGRSNTDPKEIRP